MADINPCRSCNQPEGACEFCGLEEGPVAIDTMEHRVKSTMTRDLVNEATEYLVAMIGGIQPIPDSDVLPNDCDDETTLPKNVVEEILHQAIDLHRRKNSTYTGGSSDVFANFRECEVFGIPAWKGVLCRMTDKWSRLRALAQGVPDLVGESLVDTLMDNLVYSAICIGLYQELMNEDRRSCSDEGC